MAAEKEKPTKANSPLVEEKTEDICFVIMPFGGYFDEYYQSIYLPAIEAAEMTPFRADNLNRPGNIVSDIWLYTQKAKIILADLSGKNPNVFYELGLAHAIAKPVILIAESIDDVPFDLRSLRVLEYDKNKPRWGDILQKQITKAIKEVQDSPFEAILPTFLSVDKESKSDSISENDKLILEMKRDIELLRNEVSRNRPFIREYSPSRSSISQPEAENKILEMLLNGIPESVIFRTLVELGAPEKWTIDHISKTRDDIFPKSNKETKESRDLLSKIN